MSRAHKYRIIRTTATSTDDTGLKKKNQLNSPTAAVLAAHHTLPIIIFLIFDFIQ